MNADRGGTSEDDNKNEDDNDDDFDNGTLLDTQPPELLQPISQVYDVKGPDNNDPDIP